MTTPAISARSVSKRFGATQALHDVGFDVVPGEVHALIGENGAGKSTLVRILSGTQQPDHGTLAIEGHRIRFSLLPVSHNSARQLRTGTRARTPHPEDL